MTGRVRPTKTPGAYPLALLVRDVTVMLADAGVQSPEPDALALIAFAAGSDSSTIRTGAARGDMSPANLDVATLRAEHPPPGSIGEIVGRRVERVPLQHITKGAPFRHIVLEVGKGVFVPRPETEWVTQAAIDAVAASAAEGFATVTAVDLCAGSGAIGLSIAAEVPSVFVSLVELSEDAFAFLERNASRQSDDAQRRLNLVQGDARKALRDMNGTVDVVVSNPPYIPRGAVPRDPEVALYDPEVALYGLGADGLEVPRGVEATAVRLLRHGGRFVMEHGDEQGAEVRDILSASGAWIDIETGQDGSGRDRFVVATRA